MRIEDTLVQQASRHHVEGHGKKDGLDAVKESRGNRHHHDDDGGVHRRESPDKVAISEKARHLCKEMRHRTQEAGGRELDIPSGLGKAGFLGALIRGVLSGQDVNITDVARACGAPTPELTQATAQAGVSAASNAPIATDAAALSQSGAPSATTATNSISASLEQLNFSATGTIKTGDGKEVGFTLSLNLAKASVAGLSAEQGPMSVNFAGSSSELFSMSFEFTINQAEGSEPAEGTGLLAVDDDDDADEAVEAHEGGQAARQADTAISTIDFLKALRKAEFTSTYLSFSKTTIEASSTIAIAEGAPIEAYQIPATTAGSPVPLDLVA